MRRTGLIAAGLVLVAGCGTGTGTSSTLTLPPSDAGADAVAVYLDGGGAPATPPDGAAACPAGACNYQTGTGCTATTEACVPVLSGTTVTPGCNPAGTVPGGASCGQPTDCTAGHLCAAGVCRKLCCGGDWTGCDSAADHCIEALAYSVGSGVVQTGAMLCYPVNTCDALQPASCEQAGTSCRIADPTGVTACLAEGTGTAGAPCPCKGGFTCVQPASGPAVCTRLCKAVVGGGAPYCQSGEGICTHYTRDPAGVGECLPP